jgi:hypothetical protein
MLVPIALTPMQQSTTLPILFIFLSTSSVRLPLQILDPLLIWDSAAHPGGVTRELSRQGAGEHVTVQAAA